jgi:ligand-binding sensor domain-containing protein
VAEDTLEQVTSENTIIAWTGDSRTIDGWEDRQVLEPESIYPGWMNLVSQRSVRGIAISSKSRQMWIATWGGVLSWRQRDESTYYRYSSEHGLLGNGVSSVCVDEDERPWVTHNEGGLGYFENNRWHVYSERKDEIFRTVIAADSGGVWAATNTSIYRIPGPQQPSKPVLVNNAAALALLQDGTDLLLGTSQGLFRLLNTGEFVTIEAELIKSCRSLSRDAGNQIWIGTARRVYSMKDGEVDPAPVYDENAGYVLQLAAGRDVVWVLTSEGISVIDNKVWQPVSYTSEQPGQPVPQTIAVSSSDRYLWVGTDSLLSSLSNTDSLLSGLFYSDDGRGFWRHAELPEHREDQLNNLARCFAASEQNETVWIGTAGGLVTFRTNESWTIDLTAGHVESLCVSAGPNGETLWSLCWPKGFRAQGEPATEPPGVPVTLVKGADGKVYGLTSRGLWQLGAQPKLIAERLDVRVRCLCQTPNGTWWAGTAKGAYAYNQGTWSLANEQPGPSLSEIYALVVQNDRLWVAAANGFWCRTGNKWEPHNAAQPRIVSAIAIASNGTNLWLADGKEVMRYAPNTKTTDRHYSVETSGIAGRRVAALAEIRGDLWIATEAGVSRLRLSEELI